MVGLPDSRSHLQPDLLLTGYVRISDPHCFLNQSCSLQVLFLIGKCGLTSAFGAVYVYTSELFPTSIRTAGVGTCSTCGRIGGIITPWIASIKVNYLWFLKSGHVQILNGQKEVGLQMVRISNGIWNPEAQPLENWPKWPPSCIYHLKFGLLSPDFEL